MVLVVVGLSVSCASAPPATSDSTPNLEEGARADVESRSEERWDAASSDPGKLGWMQGYPPAEDRVIRFYEGDYFSFPRLRWTVCHFRELMPTVGVARGPEAAGALEVELMPGLAEVRVEPSDGSEAMSWEEALDALYTDGVLVMHHGRLVYERYSGCMSPERLHGAMSVTKSLTGLLGEILVAEGALDEEALVGELVPELEGSAFGDATLRQVMDMTSALAFSEDYSDPNAEVWAHARAGSPLPPPEGYRGPRSYMEYLQGVEKQGTHGEAFGYKTVNADALGWVLARATGNSVAELLSERIWSRIGAEREAYYTVDSVGTPFAGGGFNATLRDLGRLGQMLLDGGRVGSEQVVPPRAIESIRQGGDREAFKAAGYTMLEGWSYRGMWWVSHDEHGAYAARGVHGQTLWIDPRADMVIVRFASHPRAANAASDPVALPAYRAVAEYVMAHDETPLLGPEWVIEDIAGEGIIDSSHATLQFWRDGRFGGSASCNRVMGSYESEGEQLTMSPAGTTRRACVPALENQERKLLKLLSQVESFRIDESGALILMTSEGSTIVARR
ncbi:META domain-containing protein [Bradymonadaceae bacterium TMQ3]|nr:META domain-containing protein [Bradymonadaceae bacterium TMQ3]TXC74690.1 serine hydrolase [Bradymonadales bacterium TMQ1]